MPRRHRVPDHHAAARGLLERVPETLAGGDLAEAERIAKLAERIGRTVVRLPPPRGGSLSRVRALEARMAHLDECVSMILAALAPPVVEDRPLPGEAACGPTRDDAS